MGWLSGWNYRKKVTISGSSGAGQNYQVKLSIGSSSGGDFHLEGHCEDFPNDIRFTDDDGETLLDYWIEDPTQDPITVWVEVKDSLDNDVDIYCYYGKSGVGDASDGNATFIYFNDLETAPSGFVTDDAGYHGKAIKQTGSSGWEQAEVEDFTEVPPTSEVVEFWFKRATSNRPANFGFSDAVEASDYWPVRMRYGDTGSIDAFDGATPVTLGTATDGNWYRCKINIDDANDKWSAWVYKEDGTLLGSNTNMDYFQAGTPHKLLGEFNRDYDVYGMWFDVLRKRKFVDPEPTFSSAGAEETAIVFLEGTSSGLTTTTALLARILQILGTSPSVSVSSGNLARLFTLLSSLATTSSSFGVLTRYLTLIGQSSATSTTTGFLTLPIYLTGATSSASTTQATVLRLRSIISQTSGTSTISGDLSLVGVVTLSGSSSALSTASSILSTIFSLLGSTSPLSTTSALLHRTTPLFGTTSSSSSLTSVLSRIPTLNGSTLPTSSLTGSLTITIPFITLAGTTSGLSTALGSLTSSYVLIGSASGSSSCTGILSMYVPYVWTDTSIRSVTKRLGINFEV